MSIPDSYFESADAKFGYLSADRAEELDRTERLAELERLEERMHAGGPAMTKAELEELESMR